MWHIPRYRTQGAAGRNAAASAGVWSHVSGICTGLADSESLLLLLRCDQWHLADNDDTAKYATRAKDYR